MSRRIFDTADSFGVIAENDMHGRYIFEATREGLWPFRPRMVETFLEYDIDYHRYIIVVEATFQKERIAKREHVDAYDLADDSYSAVFEASKKIFEAFRYREAESIPPKIQLGEN